MSEWKKAGGNTQTISLTDKVGKTVQGIYLSKEENVGPNNSIVYNIEEADGTLTSFWGSAVIDRQMDRIKPGQEVKLTYKGKEVNPTTKRQYHSFEIFYRDPEEAGSDSTPEDTGDIPF